MSNGKRNSRLCNAHVSSRSVPRRSYERRVRFMGPEVGRLPVKARKFKGTILVRCTASLQRTGQVRRASDTSNQENLCIELIGHGDGAGFSMKNPAGETEKVVLKRYTKMSKDHPILAGKLPIFELL